MPPVIQQWKLSQYRTHNQDADKRATDQTRKYAEYPGADEFRQLRLSGQAVGDHEPTEKEKEFHGNGAGVIKADQSDDEISFDRGR